MYCLLEKQVGPKTFLPEIEFRKIDSCQFYESVSSVILGSKLLSESIKV
jgi:hypothetical protein